MTNVASWALVWLGLRRSSTPPAEVEADPMVRLNRVLQIQVIRASGQGREVKLFTEEMSHQSMVYKCSTRFEVGQELRMVMLLWAGSRLELTGTVRWTRGNTGQIDFQLTPEGEAMLVSYLARRSR